MKPPRSNSLLGEYAMVLGDAVLRHRAHIAEHSARIEAEIANKMKSEFIANMSHELRTPLNTIIGFSRIMMDVEERPMPAEQVAEYAGMINEAAEHLLSIINDILDVSKIQSGKFTIERREVSIGSMIKSCASFFELTSRDAGVDLILKIQPNLPTILAEPVKLKQVFVNLISNAIKFTPEGGSVTVSATGDGRGTITVVVEDTGYGMTDEEVMVALTPFGQVDGSHTRDHEGTGLGLPIAKALIELHRATFEVESAKGVGTKITMAFPNHAEAARDRQQQSAKAQPPARNAAPELHADPRAN